MRNVQSFTVALFLGSVDGFGLLGCLNVGKRRRGCDEDGQWMILGKLKDTDGCHEHGIVALREVPVVVGVRH
jgi:hypothetical protein